MRYEYILGVTICMLAACSSVIRWTPASADRRGTLSTLPKRTCIDLKWPVLVAVLLEAALGHRLLASTRILSDGQQYLVAWLELLTLPAHWAQPF